MGTFKKKGGIIGCLIGIGIVWIIKHFFRQDINETVYNILIMFLPSFGILIGGYLYDRSKV
jgi:NhaP-type Na+/H+ or K+/H+ antiporter